MNVSLYGIILIVILSITSAHAELYRWVDENGVVTFKDYPPPVSRKHKVKIYSENDFPPAPPLTATSPPNPPRPARVAVPVDSRQQNTSSRFSGTIELFVTDWCHYCKKMEQYLKNKNYPYVRYNIEKDNNAKQRFDKLGGRGVPVAVVGSKIVSGFNTEMLEHYMNKQ